MRLTILLLCAAAANAATIATYNPTEPYGVAHATQIVCIDQGPFSRVARLLNPSGIEAAYQRTTGQICYQASLPASTIPIVLHGSDDQRASGSIYFPGVTQTFPAPKTAMYFTATAPACLTSGSVYYVAKNNFYLDQGFTVSATPGGPEIACTPGQYGNKGTPSFTFTGFTCDGTTDICTAPDHNRQTGDPLSCSGDHPTGIACDGTAYSAIRLSADTFKWATNYANAQAGTAINIGSLASGLNQILSNQTWTLVDTLAPTATAINPIVIDSSNPGYIQLTNGLTGVRVLKNPLGTPYTVAGGTIVSPGCVGNGSTITCHFSTDVNTIMCPSGCPYSTVSVSGHDEPQGVHNIVSNPDSKSILFNSSRSSTYFNSLLAVTPGHSGKNPLLQLQLSDGTWVGGDVATTYLSMGPQNGTQLGLSPSQQVPWASSNRAYSLKFLEAGPLVAVIEATYTGYKPALIDSHNIPISGSTEGTNGIYRLQIRFLANSKTVSVRESGNQNFGNWFDIYTNWPGSKPDRIGNRGFVPPGNTGNTGCGATGPTTITNVTGTGPTLTITTQNPHGYTFGGGWTATNSGINGKTVANGNFTPTPLNIYQFTIPASDASAFTSSPNAVTSGVFTNGEDDLFALTKAIDYASTTDINDGCDSVTRPPMSIYSFHPTGGVQQWVYKYGAAPTAPALGIFPGRASVQNNSINSITGFYSSSAPGLWAYTALNPCPDCPGGTFASDIARETVYYMGTVADITPNGRPQDPSPMTIEQNWVTGVGLGSLYSYGSTVADPPGGPTFTYMDNASVSAIRTLYQAGGAYKTFLDTSGGNAAIPTLATWTANNSPSIDANVLVPLLATNHRFFDCLTNGHGIFGLGCAAVTTSIDLGFLFNQVADALANPNVTPTQTAALKAIMVGACNSLLDPNYAPPSFNQLGGGFTQNQVISIIAAQQKCISGMPTNTYVTAAQRASVLSTMTALVDASLNTYGSCASSFHYCGSDLGNMLFVFLSEVKLGGFNPTRLPKLGNYLQWFADQLTPRDPRFGMVRVNPPVGDGIHQIDGHPILLATANKNFDSTTAQFARALWDCQATSTLGPMASFFGSGVTASDTSITNPGCDSLARHTNTYPGWYSVLRSHYATAMKENFLLMPNGTFYTDHNHGGDKGSVYGHILGVPWLDDPELNRNGFTAACTVHSSMCLDLNWGGTWTNALTHTQMTDGTGPQSFGSPAPTEVLDFTDDSFMQAVMTANDGSPGSQWTRNVTLISDDPDYPVVWFHDTVTGPAAASAKIFNFVMNYNGGSISTPSGPKTPTQSAMDCFGNGVVGGDSSPDTLASGLPHYVLTGDTYTALGAGGNGVNTDIYFSRANSSDQVAIMDMNHPCISGGSTTHDAFIRLLTTGGANVIFLPHVKSGAASAAPTVITGGHQIVNGSNTTTVTDDVITFTDGSKKIVRAKNANTVSAFNVSLSGGAQSVVMASSTAGLWSSTGMTAGLRCIDMSAFGGTWYANKPVMNPSANTFCIYHPGGVQPTPYSITLSTTPGTRRTLSFAFKLPTGADAVRVGVGSNTEFAALATGSGSASVSILSPLGTQACENPSDGSVCQPYFWEYLASGAVIASSKTTGTLKVQ